MKRKEECAVSNKKDERITNDILYPILSIKNPNEAHNKAAMIKMELVNLDATIRLRSYLCINMLFEILVKGKIDEYTLTQLRQISQ
mmetsp:Transcript_36564/g.36168  ORF Transcript_36564/g.36168 Transcript_36564/m.36168 type:complete len:86 (+) Transcript_36564:406-663(+)